MLPEYETQALRPEEKETIVDAMLGMAWSDADAHVHELDFIKAYTAGWIEQDIEKQSSAYEPDLERVGRKIARSDLGSTGRRILIRGLALVMAASGDVSDAEVAFYKQCVRAFNIPERELKKIEEGVRRDVYGDLIRRALASPDAEVETKLRVAAESRERLGLDAEKAKEIEKKVRESMGRITA